MGSLAQGLRGPCAHESQAPAGQARLHRGAAGVHQDVEQSVNGSGANGGHGANGRSLDDRIGIVEQSLQQEWKGALIGNQRQRFGGRAAHRHVLVVAHRGAKGWNGSTANGAEAFGKGEAQQSTPVSQAGHHALDRLGVTSETLTLPQLLLQLLSQLLGFLFAQLNRFRAAYGRHRFGHGKAEAAIHYPFLPSLRSPDCTVCCDPIRPFPQPADPGFRRASSRL